MKKTPAKKPDSRKARLAKKLRENLRKRKGKKTFDALAESYKYKDQANTQEKTSCL